MKVELKYLRFANSNDAIIKTDLDSLQKKEPANTGAYHHSRLGARPPQSQLSSSKLLKTNIKK